MREALASVTSRLLDAILPEECVVCEQPLVEGEKFVCLHCQADMPLLNFGSFTDNAMHHTLASTRPFERAAALMAYRKGSPFTRLVHIAKYNDRPQLARHLGVRLGTSFYSRGLFDGVDALIPIPLNRWKFIKRGYNQSLEIAKGVSRLTGIPIADVLGARRHSTQTRKNAVNRRRNASGVYRVDKPHMLKDLKHVMLVDDVVTTGSTMLECAGALRSANPSIQISALSVALSQL